MMPSEVDINQLAEMLELKKVNTLQEAVERLNHELTTYTRLSRLIAFAKSKEATDELGLTLPPPPAEDDSGNGEEVSPVAELTRRRTLLMEAMRASLFIAANRMKQYAAQEREARAAPEVVEVEQEE